MKHPHKAHQLVVSIVSNMKHPDTAQIPINIRIPIIIYLIISTNALQKFCIPTPFFFIKDVVKYAKKRGW